VGQTFQGFPEKYMLDTIYAPGAPRGGWARAGAVGGAAGFDATLAGLDVHRCELYLNGALAAEGEGSAVLGHPARAAN
jgi:hypothetical protein